MLKTIDERESLSAREFHDQYLSLCKPVLLRGLADSSQALHDWNPQFFAQRYGNMTVEITHRDETRERVPLRSYLERVESGDLHAGYLRDWKIAHIDPALFAHIPDLGHFATDLLEHHESTRGYLKEIFIGPAGSSTFMHVDVWQSHSWMLLVTGAKRWIMCPPGEIQRAGITRGKDTVAFQKAVSENLGRLDHLEFDLQRGDVIYVPSGWWHQVKNLEVSIAVTYNFVDAYSLSAAYKMAEKNVRMFDSMVGKEIDFLRTSRVPIEKDESRFWQAQAFARVLEERVAHLTNQARDLTEKAATLRQISRHRP